VIEGRHALWALSTSECGAGRLRSNSPLPHVRGDYFGVLLIPSTAPGSAAITRFQSTN
jgi:hypothetical protein